MTNSASHDIDRIAGILADHGYAIDASPVGSALLATRRGRALGPLLPYADFIFLHDCSAETSSATFEEFQLQARAYVDEQFSLPSRLRYRIPNIVSIGVSENGFSPEAIAFAEGRRQLPHVGRGEKHSTYLFDITGRRLYAQGPNPKPRAHGDATVKSSDRIPHLMAELAEKLFAK